eukprot:CAMPEP_0179452748 /NCGR_PEP_ID=MMETSP0799-20121207/36595_1 /TAXON_ID=46947 /ORGANISM="Geminigera cryophila, Strain CCMP2564" /LENGTH=61 /DNA_ID=CAMNT_0021248903 /DNA_START=52 /DNA_END=237 /DNA_ORIENTATION=+
MTALSAGFCSPVDHSHCLTASTSRKEEVNDMLPWEKYDKLMPPHHIDTTTIGARKSALPSR